MNGFVSAVADAMFFPILLRVGCIFGLGVVVGSVTTAYFLK